MADSGLFSEGANGQPWLYRPDPKRLADMLDALVSGPNEASGQPEASDASYRNALAAAIDGEIARNIPQPDQQEGGWVPGSAAQPIASNGSPLQPVGRKLQPRSSAPGGLAGAAKTARPGNVDTTCIGFARVLKGNARTINKDGAFQTPVEANSAAIIPQQFGGRKTAGLRPYRAEISGSTSNGMRFNGVTDVIGNKHSVDGLPVREGLQARNPGKFILELPSAKYDPGVAAVQLRVPNGLACPVGTTDRP